MPTDAIRAARTMKSRKTPDSSTFSLVRCSTSSQTTASLGPGGPALGLVGGPRDHRVDRLEHDRAALVDAERTVVQDRLQARSRLFVGVEPNPAVGGHRFPHVASSVRPPT
jgi:hypothetical protein